MPAKVVMKENLPLSSKTKLTSNSDIKSFKASANEKRSAPEKFADWLTSFFGSITFLTVNVIWFAIWIVINTGLTPIEPFDEFPFGLLTMVVSLEAIVLAIIVLISQNREARIAELREEIDLQINKFAEKEVSKTIELLMLSLKKQGVNVKEDPELKRILGISNEEIEKEIEKELDNSN